MSRQVQLTLAAMQEPRTERGATPKQVRGRGVTPSFVPLAANSSSLDTPAFVNKPETSRANPQPRARFSEEHRILLGILIEARLASGLSQKAVSRLLGKPHNHLQFIESNDRDLTYVEASRIATIVELPLTELARRYAEGLEQLSHGKIAEQAPEE